MEHTADHEYWDDKIQTALYDAYSTVYDVVAENKLHPINELYIEHTVHKLKSAIQKRQNNKLTYMDMQESDKQLNVHVPILPRDLSLIDAMVAGFMTALK